MSAEYFKARERALLGERYDTLYAAPQETAARGVTVSALRTTSEEFAARADFPLRPSPFCKAAFVVEQPDFKPGRHPYHHAGVFYSQEPSASSAAPLLGVKPGMRVLDLCAAPGGKSSQLAAALQGQGLLVSNEYVAARAEILKSNLERMGVSNAVVLNETPARIAAALPEFFDRVLVDAPCSGEGMFRKEPAALAQHCEALVKQCAELGADILDSAAAALAPGGELVYSTCTFAPEEDEGQVAAFLQRHPEFTLADVLGNVDYPFGSEGEANRTGGLPLDVSKVRRIWPCQGGEGHFMARLVKAGTPRALPAPGEYTPEEQLWLAAAAEAGKKAKGSKPQKAAKPADARSARRENSRVDLLSFVHAFAPEVSDLFGCSAALSRALNLEERQGLARTRLEGARRLFDELAAQGGQALEAMPEGLTRPGRPPEETEEQLAAVTAALERVERLRSMALGEQRAVGDPAALAARREELQGELDRRKTEYEAISIALDALKRANTQLQERFSPELNRRAGEWMARLTGGKYAAVSLTRELEAAALERDSVLPRRSLALSRGTVDQLYLAVRLAVCQLCLPGEDPAPLVLDDALVTFDDRRMALALDALAELGRERQILLFTCQEREGNYLEGRPGVTRTALRGGGA